jgi:hypothetical protein
MKRSLGPRNFFVIFLTFERDTTILRGTLVENVKNVKNQPTLLYSKLELKRVYLKTISKIVISDNLDFRKKCQEILPQKG